MEQIKLTRNELMEILGVKYRAMTKIEKERKLEERLSDKGYKFIEKKKEGVKNFYIVGKESNGDDKELLTNIIKNCYKTKEYLTFSEYYTIRYVFAKMNWQGATIKKIADYVGVHENTIYKWDKTLKESEMLKQDGYYYYKLDTESGEEVEIDEWEYKTYWNNTRDIQAMKEIQDDYDNGKITFNKMRIAIREYEAYHEAIEGKYCFRVKKYIINELNLLCGDVWKLIKKCYLTDIGLEYLKIRK
jgi:Putative ATPase subunit of terminase (gpP-like).